MKIRALALLLLVGYDFSLHLAELLNKVALHPLYITFPFYGINYNLFWTCYWGVATLIMITLLGSGTVIKNKTINHIHNELPKINKESDGKTSVPDNQ